MPLYDAPSPSAYHQILTMKDLNEKDRSFDTHLLLSDATAVPSQYKVLFEEFLEWDDDDDDDLGDDDAEE